MSGAGDIGLGLAVGAAVNRVVRPLEEKQLAILHQLDAGVLRLLVEVVQAFARQHDRHRDVVFHLHFVRGIKIGPQFVDAPGAILIESDAQVIADEFLIVEFQLVAPEPVDAIDGEMLAPLAAPFGQVVALHGENELRESSAAASAATRCVRRYIPRKA